MEQAAAEEEAAKANQQWEAHSDVELREALSKIQRLEESPQASVGGQDPTGHTTGLTIGQPSPVLPSSASRGAWAAPRERLPMMTAVPQAPPLTGASTGVPTVVAPSAVRSTHGAALPATMVQNPTTPLLPLGFFPLNLFRSVFRKRLLKSISRE